MTWDSDTSISMTNSVNILSSPGLGNLCLSNTAHLFGGKIIMSLCFGDILTKTCIEFVFSFKHLITFTSVYCQFCGFPSCKYTLSSRYGLVQSNRKRSTNCRLRSSVEIISGDDLWTHQSQAWRVRKRTRSVSRRAAES